MQARTTMTTLGYSAYTICALFVACYGHSHRRPHYVSAGHIYVLRCGSTVGRLSNVTWSRAENHTMGLPSGTELRNGDLWFLPVDASHNGTYTCEIRNQRGAREVQFMVSVTSGQCPDPAERREFKQGTTDDLPCKQMDILRLKKNTTHVRWLKDCRPLERDGKTVEVDMEGGLRLYGASKDDDGVYTCLINITLDGQTHTSARSIQLHIHNRTGVIFPPRLLYPNNDTRLVELGSSAELRCKAHLGLSEHEENFMDWMVDVPHIDDHPRVHGLLSTGPFVYIHEGEGVYGVSTLKISEVIPELLNVSIRCIVRNPTNQAEGWLWLQKADHTELHTCVGVGLAFGLVVVLLLSGYFFRVDLVLAYRKLCPHQQIPDGKEYDAYVSYLHGDDVSSSGTATFALHVLPEVLEKQHGYRLYIRGRDDCPGEAIHDVIAASVRGCRRLIIIMSADVQSSKNAGMEEVLPLKQSQNHESYEQKIGLHDALMQNDPRVILVEMDGPLDYSGHSASLRYIRKQQGALQWNTASSGNQSCTRLPSNGHFWKCLRYYMPPVPGRRPLSTVV